MIRIITFCFVGLAGTIAGAQSISFPSNAVLTRSIDSGLDSYAMPIGPWSDGAIPTKIVEGQLTQQAWRILATGLTTLQIVRPLREQIRNDGFEIVFECQDRDCGGYDFRFGTIVMPPPDIQVNLGDFRYLAAQKNGAEGPEILSVLASKSARAGYVQVTKIGPTGADIAAADAAPVRGNALSTTVGDMATDLSTKGRSILNGLTFETGSSKLASEQFAALQDLADFLASQPNIAVALVGHTDSSGSLDGNIVLSKRRAGSVLERLVSDYGVTRRQLDAQGMGYLAPIASNMTQEGRDANRRVEVIITSTQ
ncbi:MAG: OmpA family protein [Yoonia sp.]|nr:OmpA family protein [Yoonia sp.]